MLVGAFNAVASAAKAATDAVKAFIDAISHADFSGLGDQILGGWGGARGVMTGAEEHVGGTFASMGEGGGEGEFPAGTAHFTPGGGKGGHKGHKKGGGGADPMAGLDESLDLSKDKMDEMANQFQKLGSEATMAAKEGGQSFDQLRADATADYEKMQEKYKEFTDAVQAGNKQAAQDSKKEWQQAAQDFEKAWKEAAQKAQQDMQQFKQMADQMANEVSGILNTAITGKVNWAAGTG